MTKEQKETPKKLICPVCGVEHNIDTEPHYEILMYYFVTDEDCPLHNAEFQKKEIANDAMQKLIYAFDNFGYKIKHGGPVSV